MGRKIVGPNSPCYELQQQIRQSNQKGLQQGFQGESLSMHCVEEKKIVRSTLKMSSSTSNGRLSHAKRNHLPDRHGANVRADNNYLILLRDIARYYGP